MEISLWFNCFDMLHPPQISFFILKSRLTFMLLVYGGRKERFGLMTYEQWGAKELGIEFRNHMINSTYIALKSNIKSSLYFGMFNTHEMPIFDAQFPRKFRFWMGNRYSPGGFVPRTTSIPSARRAFNGSVWPLRRSR